MGTLSPAAVLYDDQGHAIAVVQDSVVYRLRVEGKVAKNSSGNIDYLQMSVGGGLKETLYDAAGNAVTVSQDGSDYKLEVLGKVRKADGTVIDPAAEGTLQTVDGRLVTIDAVLDTIDAVLDSIKDTDGIKKITDALPAGTNNIGRIVIADANGDEANVSSSGKLEVAVGVDAKNVILAYLEDSGGSQEMAVDGDPTPVEFTWSPGSATVEGSSLSFVIEDSTIYFGDKFGGIGALTNGIEIEVKAQDEVYVISTIKRTREFAQEADPGGFDVYSATPDMMKAEISIEGFIFMPTGTYATDDYVKVTIQDDIDGLAHMSCLFKGRSVGS